MHKIIVVAVASDEKAGGDDEIEIACFGGGFGVHDIEPIL